ncbi:MAG: C1 family peptidase [Scytonematopsis contorta HA4267-MV1]|jgi:C1A family cysteine protease|nr:C1 family peptidase [Scytonematopsis contorta HA4267-MV1]
MNYYLVERSTGKRLFVNGCIPSGKTPEKLTNIFPTTTELPPEADLRGYMPTVEDQGQIGSCTANTLAGACEYLVNRQYGGYDFSRLFIYYNARKRDNIEGDRGSSIATSVTVMTEQGVCSEATWSYEPQLVDVEPSQIAYQEAKNFIIKDARQLPVDLYTMKNFLANGYPFAFGIKLFNSFQQVNESGWVTMPDPNSEGGLEVHGHHAMLCVGYSDNYQVFIVRNSWSESWGHGGYCYIPYDYLANPEYCFDLWAICEANLDSPPSSTLLSISSDITSNIRWATDKALIVPAFTKKDEYDYEFQNVTKK